MSFRTWWHNQRSSARLGFLLQLFSRGVNALLALWWMRALSSAMGDTLYGIFVNFQYLAALGALGDLGVGGVIGIQVGKYLGEGRIEALKPMLSAARTMLFLLAMLVLVLGCVLAPFLPNWLGFQAQVTSSGSLPLLFALGAGGAALSIVASYITTVNTAAGNITWPILPSLLLTQIAILAQWLLARGGATLAAQFLPYLISSTITIVFVWISLRFSYRPLAAVFPLRIATREWIPLAIQSFWSYLWTIGVIIFLVTDRALINKGFGGAEVTRYHFSSKLLELAYFVVIVAGSVSIPKITQWMASPDSGERARAIQTVTKLNDFQTFLGTLAAVAYLGLADLFVWQWFGAEYRVSLIWQLGFALSLGISSASAAMTQVSSRCGEKGLRSSGILVALTGGLNLLLSWIAMKLGSIAGIIFATAVSQSVFSILIGRLVCSHLNMPFRSWLLRNLLLPLTLVSVAFIPRLLVPNTTIGAAVYVVISIVVLRVAAKSSHVDRRFLANEFQVIRGMMQRPRSE